MTKDTPNGQRAAESRTEAKYSPPQFDIGQQVETAAGFCGPISHRWLCTSQYGLVWIYELPNSGWLNQWAEYELKALVL